MDCVIGSNVAAVERVPMNADFGLVAVDLAGAERDRSTDGQADGSRGKPWRDEASGDCV